MQLLEESDIPGLYRTIRTLHYWTEQVVVHICRSMGEDISHSPMRKPRPVPICNNTSQQRTSPEGERKLATSPTSSISSRCPITLDCGQDSGDTNPPSGQDAKEKPTSLTFRSGWRTMVGYYFNEMLNFPDYKEETFRQLIGRISYQTSIPEQQVEELLITLIGRASDSTDYGMPGFRVNYVEDMALIQVGMLNFRMARYHYQRLLKFTSGDNDILIKLLLRYYPLGTGGGFFWSVDPVIYKWLEGPLPLLECFASPFNYNTKVWCSPFEADRTFGSQGNFFNYIEQLQTPMRLIVNPPYTKEMLERTTRAVLNYLQRVEGSEAVLIYPSWNYLNCYTLLNQWPGSSNSQVERGSYNLYDYSSGERIMTPMTLNLFVLTSPLHPLPFSAEALKLQFSKLASTVERRESQKAPRNIERASNGSPPK